MPPPIQGAAAEAAFLPAALEVVETPPSPAERAIGAVIIAFFCTAIGWASVGMVDIVANPHRPKGKPLAR